MQSDDRAPLPKVFKSTKTDKGTRKNSLSVSRKPCKHCGGVSHQSWQCHKKGRTEMVKSRLVKKGKVGKQWDLTRAKWFREHPQDVYDCYLRIAPDCWGSMRIEHTTLDHIKSRSRHPELRFVQSNLAPACWPCNIQKGSKDLEEL